MSTAKNLFKVFVYGTLKKHQPNNHWFSKKDKGYSSYLCDGETETKYPLLIATKYNVPFLLNEPGIGNCIIGEIYEVDEKMLANLDELEDYPKLYDRIILTIHGTDG